MDNFKVWYTKEPKLIFGKSKIDFDPKIGIFNNSFFYEENSLLAPNQINIGIVGDKDSIAFIEDWINKLKNPIPNNKDDPYLFPFYPGFKNLGIDLINKDQWNKELSSREIDEIIKVKFNMKRIGLAANLFIKELEVITEQTMKPHVIFIGLPISLDKYIAPATFYTKNIHKQSKYSNLEKKIIKNKKVGQKQIGAFVKDINIIKIDREKYYNFRRILKAKIMEMENPIPIQIFRPKRFINRTDIQIDSEIAWNLSVGLFYKAGGIPWKVQGLEKNACYVGISFYREKESKNLRSSIAQIFSETGEGLVLRGKKFQWEGKGYPHLDASSAFKLLSDAIDLYKKHWKIVPRRLILHKSSFYDEEELDGFYKAIKNIPVYDFLSFGYTNIRFLRSSIKYPVLRGTTAKTPNNKLLIYIKGFNPYLKTYRGHGIPRPLFISHHHGDTPLKSLSDELMSLSRLNWNSADFCLNSPITTHFARQIGHILSEYNPKKPIQREYRFYM